MKTPSLKQAIELRKRYLAGESYVKLAYEFDLSPRGLRALLVSMGVEIRHRGMQTGDTRINKITPQQLQALYDDGYTAVEAAEFFKVSRQAVDQYGKRYGILPKGKFTRKDDRERIMKMCREYAAGAPVADLCREYNLKPGTVVAFASRYGFRRPKWVKTNAARLRVKERLEKDPGAFKRMAQIAADNRRGKPRPPHVIEAIREGNRRRWERVKEEKAKNLEWLASLREKTDAGGS